MATLEAIQEKIKKLQAQADALIAKKAQAAVDQIRKIMIDHGLTTEEIEASAKAKRDAKFLKTSSPKRKPSTKTTAKNAGAKPQPKYQDNKTGATWSGFGRAPAWIADAKDRTKFLITSDAAKTKGSIVSAAPAAKKVAAKRVAAKKAVAKKIVTKKAGAKTPAAKKVVAKKAPIKKVATKKTAAKKAAMKKTATNALVVAVPT